MRLTLKEARERRNFRWTPDELAARASVSRATVYRIEAGEIANPLNDTVAKLEEALKLKRGTLIFGAPAVMQAAS
jgi:transcriptional regulator with XRE-family HTH domain